MRARLLVAALIACFGAPVQAFQRTTYCNDGSGPDLWWPGGGAPVSYQLSKAWIPLACRVAAGNATDESRLKPIVDASFSAWTAANLAGSGCTNWSVQAGSVVTSATLSGSDRQNRLIWRHGECPKVVPAGDACRSSGCADSSKCVTDCSNKYNCWEHVDSSGAPLTGVLALTWVSYLSTGQIVDADIEFHDWDDTSSNIYAYTCTESTTACRSNAEAVAGGCVWIDTQSIVTHEAGHFLGLDHPCTTCSPVMAAFVSPGTRKALLTTDDAAGVCAIYPAGSSAAVQHLTTPATCEGGSLAQSGGKGCGCGGEPASALWTLLAPLLLLRRKRPGDRLHG